MKTCPVNFVEPNAAVERAPVISLSYQWRREVKKPKSFVGIAPHFAAFVGVFNTKIMHDPPVASRTQLDPSILWPLGHVCLISFVV
jgi:hypothetical protein